ncbi:MAG: hypothetical protein NTX25_14415 [Proteobacteria bacterium]|nr:hypothetical protein [Pseudomonadota bacterium]
MLAKLLSISLWCISFELLAGTSELPSDAIGIRLGSFKYKTAGTNPSLGQESGLLSIEFGHYFKKNLVGIFAYRTVDKSDVKRNLYQASAGALRYFPYTLGMPVSGIIDGNSLSLDTRFKPYLETGISIGRYLVAVAGNPAVFDISSQFYGLVLGLGTYVQLTQTLALDICLAYENDIGYGSPVDMKATNNLSFFGMTWLF